MNLLQAIEDRVYTLDQINLDMEWTKQLFGMGMTLNCAVKIVRKFRNKVVVKIAENVQLVIDSALANMIVVRECE